jgi:VWFA-related protein
MTPAVNSNSQRQGFTMKTRRTPLFAVLTALLLGAAFAGAQVQEPVQTPPAPAVSVPPVDTHQISIDVHVTDKLGHEIPALKAEDFTLLDNKQPAKILDFREIDARNGADDPVHVVIVIDMINTGFDAVAREREQLGEFLKQDGGRLGHPTSLAMLTEKGIKIQQTSSLDGKVLLDSLESSDSALRMVGRSAGFWGAADRLNWSLNQLTQLAAYEATQPGRKIALFISPGWPLLGWAGVDATDKQRKWTFSAIVGLTNALREAHVTLYALDPFQLGRTDPFYYQNFLKPITDVNHAEYGDLGLQIFAVHTGGLALVTGMDILGELNTAMRDANACYRITFEARAADRRDEYHELRLQVDKPGEQIRTTAGYYANVQQ